MRKVHKLNENQAKAFMRQMLKEEAADTALELTDMLRNVQDTIAGAPEVVEWLNTASEFAAIKKGLIQLVQAVDARVGELKRAGKVKQRELPGAPKKKSVGKPGAQLGAPKPPKRG